MSCYGSLSHKITNVQKKKVTFSIRSAGLSDSLHRFMIILYETKDWIELTTCNAQEDRRKNGITSFWQ